MGIKTLQIDTAGFEAGSTGSGWQKYYGAGAAAALLVVLAGLLDILIMFLPGTGASPGARTVSEWYSLLQSQWFLAMRDMGLLNMISISCSLGVFFALFGMHRRTHPLAAALALILVGVGAAIYIANNTALPMLTLSQHYASAASESQRALWVSAGQALLAREDLTAGAFPGFFFVEAAGFLMAGVALRGGLFRRWEAGVGMVSAACLFFFNLVAAFIPAWYASVMPIFGAGGGLLGMLWYALIARRLIQMTGCGE